MASPTVIISLIAHPFSVAPVVDAVTRRQINALLLHPGFQPLDTLLAAQTALFKAPERGRNRKDFVGVDPHRACLQLLAETQGATGIACPDPRCQAVHRVVD